MSALFQAEHTDVISPQGEAAETLYLLDGSFHVVGVRAATGEAALERGSAFFEHYRMNGDDASLLLQVLRTGSEQSLLLASEGGPVLLLTALFRRTGLLVAAVPHGALADQLSAAHHYADALQTMLLVSGRLQNCEVTKSAEGYCMVCEWIAKMEAPFFKERGWAALPNCAAALEDALQALARLCCSGLDCELSELRGHRFAEIDLKLVTGIVLAALLLVHRVSADRCATLLAVSGDGREPKLKLTFETKEDTDGAWELTPLTDRALWQGDVLALSRDPEKPTRVQLLFDACGKELSVQGVKVKLPFEKSYDLPFFAE